MNKSVPGPFKRNTWDSRRPLSYPPSLLVFTDRSYGDFSLGHWNPGMGLDLIAPQGYLCG